MADMLKPFGNQSFLVGLGVAAVGYFFGPQIKQAMRPMAVKGAQGMMTLTDRTKHMMHEGKHMMGNMMEKGQMMAKDHGMPMDQMGMYELMMKELREERERSNRLMEQLNQSIAGLKEEINQIKSNTVMES